MTLVQPEIDREVAGKRLLILGAGLWQVGYIRRARLLGVDTWATDWSPLAVGRSEADHFEPIDVTNLADTIAFARHARVDGVLTAADVAVPTAAAVAAELGLPGHSIALAHEATNKLAMRRRSQQLGIPCPWYRHVSSEQDAALLLDALIFPVIVKPVDNCSSRGVRYVSAGADLMPAVAEALRASRTSGALVEQFLTGSEGSIEALVQEGRVTILGICDKTKSPLPNRYDLELRYPGAYDEDLMGDLIALAERIVQGFTVTDGILHIEFLVPAETRLPFLIEFAIRGCGSKVVTHLMPELTGIDVVRFLVRQALGFRTPIQASRCLHGALHFLMFPPGRVTAISGIDQARAVPGVVDVCIERRPGEVIGEVRDGRSRPGHVLVSGDGPEAVRRTLAAVRHAIRLDYEHAAGVAPL